jgi:2-polyprenyl-6-methoxyphenol hydroxylase-like FAD-dependent oxidoreductase
MERRYVIEVLYGHIQDKSKVLTQKRIMTINITEFGVRVVTKDGSTYEGDIIIGADGVNSTVRKEMERNANERQAGLILESAKTGE